MNERKYSIDEIDRMRATLQARQDSLVPIKFYQCGNLPNHHPVNLAYREQFEASVQRSRQQVEEQLRTYMIAGIDPKEIAP